jgi:hypothetical protein
MKHHTLRELAKVGVGIFIADILSLLWFTGTGYLPMTILGITWTSQAVLPATVFDLAIIVLLAHYGWNMKLPIQSPTERGLLKLVGFVFLIVALLHLLRLAFGWSLILGTASVPLWVSWLGVIIPAYLSYASFHFSVKRGK